MTQLVVASTLFGASTAAAAVDAGLLGPADTRRVLVVVNNAAAPELTPALDEIPGCDPVLERFYRVVHLTDLVAPVHPSDWATGSRERPVMERLLRSYWGLGEEQVEIVCESVWVNPAQNLARIFHDAPVTVYADGLMSYGPTRDPLPLDVAQRLQGLLHLDLVPGLRPVLLSEYGVVPTVVPSEAFLAVMNELAADRAPRGDDGEEAAIVVGQYLAALGLVTRAEESAMHARMIRAAAEAGASLVRFKPHPSAPPGMLAPLHDAARQVGVRLEVLDDPLPVEVMLLSSRHVALIGCFSTALVTARSILDMPTIAVDTEMLLRRLTPYENSNRIPLTIVDAVHRKSSPYESLETMQSLVDTVAYCMQPKSLRDRRGAAASFLGSVDHDERQRYVRATRLTALSMPGGPRPHPAVAAATSIARRTVRHPAFGWLDERTRTSGLRRKISMRIHG